MLNYDDYKGQGVYNVIWERAVFVDTADQNGGES